MQVIKEIDELRKTLNYYHKQLESVALVPTMGNLHDGHLSLVNAAREQADRLVVSIFVNPIQFGEGEDFSSYPRTEQHDIEMLQQAGVDVVFMPSVEQMYPSEMLVTVKVTGISDAYCGQSRPGHFDGVATVVSKLFNIVQPDMAFFGEKDFQQLAIIRQMVLDLNFNIQVKSMPIVREADGLAMSSRNHYLTSEQRAIAPKLYQALSQARDEILSGNRDFADIEQKQLEFLGQAGFKPDYFSIARQSDLKKATEKDDDLVILVAAWLGKPRLIDNLTFSRGKEFT